MVIRWHFFKNDFSIAMLQMPGKLPKAIERLQSSLIGSAKIFAPFLPEEIFSCVFSHLKVKQ